MQRINTLIFDVSGVLVNDLPAVFRANREAYLIHGYDPPQTIEEFREKFTFPIREFHKGNGVPEEMIDEVERTYTEKFPLYKDLVQPFSEVKEALSEISQKGIKLGIYSHMPGEVLRELLEKYGIIMYFETIIGRDDCGKKKPSPEPLLTALSRLDATPETAAYIGDMEEDMMMGKNAGVSVIAMDRRGAYQSITRLKSHNPDYIINSLYDLLEIF